ncbi:MAG: tetratricopeptide repeat protein [Anaerolineae bacterium]|nr:tetratricopeptide repeat protein [Anaerolineae bacterium]
MKEVFPLSKTFRSTGQMLMGMMTFLYVILLTVWIVSPVDRWDMTMIMLVMLPFDLIGLYFWARHTGQVILTDTTIRVERFGYKREIDYSQIVSFKEQDAHIPANFVLKTDTTTLRFSRKIEAFPELYALLREKVYALRDLDQQAFPWTLYLKPKFYLDWILSILTVLLIIGGLSLVGNKAPNAAKTTQFILLVALPAIILLLLAAFSEFRNTPRQIIFDANQIQILPLLGTPKTWDTRAMTDIYLDEVTGSASWGSIRQRIRYVEYSVVITLDDGREVVFEQPIARNLGLSTERLHAGLRRLYFAHPRTTKHTTHTQTESRKARADHFVKQGNAYHRQKQYDQAIVAYRQAMALYSVYEAFQFIIGEMLMEMQRYDEALDAYQQTIDRTPDHEQAWNDMGKCLVFLQRYEEATRAFERAIKLDPDYAEALYSCALAYTKIGDRLRARRYMEQALKLKPEWEPYARQDGLLAQYFKD